MTYPGPWDAKYMEEQYELWKSDPEKVAPDWRHFFQGFELGLDQSPESGGVCDEDSMRKQSQVEALIYRFRDVGHLMSCLDPLESCPTDHPLLNLQAFGLDTEDLSTSFYAPGLSNTGAMPLKNIIQTLRQTYCRSMGVEYMHLQDPEERKWLQERMEPILNHPEYSVEEKTRIANKLSQAKGFEQFLHKKYLGQKRFSLEGAEVIIPMLDFLFDHAAEQGCREILFGMAHRGRLNVQVNVFNKRYEDIFRDFEKQHNPEGDVGTGDVKYHKGFQATLNSRSGKEIKAFMAHNPSHLESVNPVVEGMARARLDAMGGDFSALLPVLIHGDAAFAGQGVVMETLNMSQLAGYRTGGTIHLIINNQIGYTTLPKDARSTRYATDMAKGLMVPIFHVQGENPEVVLHAARLAYDFRAAFQKDVIIDVVCYRQYGHNEGDEPYFTQPLMYDRIRKRPSPDKLYAKGLLDSGILDQEALNQIKQDVETCLEHAFETAKTTPKPAEPIKSNLPPLEKRLAADTKIQRDELLELSESINRVPAEFNIHRKLEKLLERRRDAVQTGEGIDWANGELLAFASLLSQGLPVRLSGEDVQRGTFAQRQSVLFDTQTNEPFAPLNHINEKQGAYVAVNSLLSEAGVLGFEYGYSLIEPKGLTIWEAQFGDFVNNAQVIIDQYLVAGESKWQSTSGLVLLLPHGYEGMGPEHSSARMERFLQLCAGNNLVVCNPSTPAQHFHMLRRQALGMVQKPLVVFTPKSLLRNPLAVSKTSDLTDAGFFPVLDDPAAPKKTSRVVLASGKVYYDILRARMDKDPGDTALVRVEQLYPFPEKELKKILSKYKQCKTWIWAQEEPENMGAWRFMSPRFQKAFSKELDYVGRAASASPVTSYHHVFVQEQEKIVQDALYK